MMHFFLLTHTLKVFRRVEFVQRSEVRIGIGAHIDEQIDFLDLDRDFPYSCSVFDYFFRGEKPNDFRS